jgi:hypothetical protein
VIQVHIDELVLTDGSKVYDVVLTQDGVNIRLHAIDQRAADALAQHFLVAIAATTNHDVKWRG